MTHYFNNNFDEISAMIDYLNKKGYVEADDLRHLATLKNRYGIQPSYFKTPFQQGEKARLKAIEEWISFEYPDAEMFTDLEECRHEKDILQSIIDNLKNRFVIRDVPKSNNKLETKEEKQIIKATPVEVAIMISIPVSVITIIGFVLQSLS